MIEERGVIQFRHLLVKPALCIGAQNGKFFYRPKYRSNRRDDIKQMEFEHQTRYKY
jgi:hypothetical protein